MSRAQPVVSQSGELVGYFVECPGCQSEPDGTSGHIFSLRMATGTPGWSFNGDLERPTFSPSMLARSSHPTGERVCHSFVRNGRIEYLGDCTHAMAGQTIDLPEVDRD